MGAGGTATDDALKQRIGCQIIKRARSFSDGNSRSDTLRSVWLRTLWSEK